MSVKLMTLIPNETKSVKLMTMILNETESIKLMTVRSLTKPSQLNS